MVDDSDSRRLLQAGQARVFTLLRSKQHELHQVRPSGVCLIAIRLLKHVGIACYRPRRARNT